MGITLLFKVDKKSNQIHLSNRRVHEVMKNK